MALLANNTADRSRDRSIDNTSETIILYAEREELLLEQELVLFSFIRRVLYVPRDILAFSLTFPVYLPSRSWPSAIDQPMMYLRTLIVYLATLFSCLRVAHAASDRRHWERSGLEKPR